MGDLPAPLVNAALDWIGCDACDHDGWNWCEDLDCATLSHRHPCRRSHVVVAYEGRIIHADPDRVTKWCTGHNCPLDADAWDDNGELYGCWASEIVRNGDCLPVLRPVMPLDLETGEGRGTEDRKRGNAMSRAPTILYVTADHINEAIRSLGKPAALDETLVWLAAESLVALIDGRVTELRIDGGDFTIRRVPDDEVPQ